MYPLYQNQMNTVYQRPPGYDYTQERDRRYDQYDKDRLQIYKENDNIYLNIVMQNNNTQTNNENNSLAEYNVTKTLPILDKCSDYYCSVIRFDIPLTIVPLYIVPIIPASVALNPQPNPNLTPLIIGITYLGVNYPRNLIYTPLNNVTPPVQDIIGIQKITPYYYSFTYSTLITMLNTALSNAITDSGYARPANTSDPYFYLDPITELINFVVPNAYTVAPANNVPQIFINIPLLNYLEGFKTFFIGYGEVDGRDLVFQFYDAATGPIIEYPTYAQASDVSGNPLSIPLVPPARSAYWKFSQEYSSLNYWSSLRKIIIATNTIPIVNEFVPAQDNGSGVSNSFPILTDYVPNLEIAGQTRSIAYYYPTSQYRLVDMINDNPLYKINLKIYWEDKQGNLYPLYIPIFQQANIKIGFFRKTLYKSMNMLLYK